MVCYRPKDAFNLPGSVTPNGKRVIVFSVDQCEGKLYERFQVPCQRCVGCLLDRSRDWAIRCVHENQQYNGISCFITLTLSPESINSEGSLQKDLFPLFMKRLRKRYVRTFKQSETLHGAETRSIRYFHCGEYGSSGNRPHYHAILFGFMPDDLVEHSRRHGVTLYTSESLSEVWSQEIQPEECRNYQDRFVFERHGKYYVSLGYVTVGQVTWESAAYVARYVLKKQFGKDRYEDLDKETGVITNRIPEFCSMSNRPGIGRAWVEKYWKDFYPKNYMLFKGKRIRPPKYYDKVVEEFEPELLERVKSERRKQAKKLALIDPQRRLDAEQIKIQQITKLERIYDNDF